MTVSRLLAEADSRELSAWLLFLTVKHEKEDAARRDAALERRLTGV